MTEYLIREETLTEIANIVREKFEYCDMAVALISKRYDGFGNIITIPEGVTSIGNYAFWGCDSLKSITIPDSVTDIDNNVFGSCYSLESVTISKNIESIGNGAFWGCDSLTDIYLRSTTPFTLYSVYSLATTSVSTVTATIHVPVGSGNAYKSATNWSSFADKIIEDIVLE